MSILPLQRVQCDRCLSVFVLTAKRSDQWGAELFDAGWRARPIRGSGVYKHACQICASQFIVEADGRKARAARSGPIACCTKSRWRSGRAMRRITIWW
jgi:hypothetical protein